ncbi:MAG TPA: hypothetical protein VN285_08990 [Candidatus Deferrimicrobium sp.]|nr:hypothetical protein [Candidatus Deferrimicrobium sp.]
MKGLDLISSNGVEAYIDPRLTELLQQFGTISVDYVTNLSGSGFTIKVGSGSCNQSGCSC